jgi:hypothetical protein
MSIGLINTSGYFYSKLSVKNQYDEKSKQCIQNTVTKLLENNTSVSRPGMLLGKIQSGKTRTFIGITALSFDNGYDVTIVLTKGHEGISSANLRTIKNGI